MGGGTQPDVIAVFSTVQGLFLSAIRQFDNSCAAVEKAVA